MNNRPKRRKIKDNPYILSNDNGIYEIEFKDSNGFINKIEINKYHYDNNGNLTKLESNADIVKYIYDLSQKINEYQFNNFKIKYIYDTCDNVIGKEYYLDNIQNIISNTLNREDTITKTEFDNNIINYLYDSLGRLNSRNINNAFNTSYTYLTNGNRTSLLVDSINNNDDIYNYKYDQLNNITHIYHNHILENEYEYDEYNQLIEEKNYIDNEIIKYKYDNFGNILNRKILDINNYDIKLEDKYEYNNSNWQDQLTKYNDINITYDNIGNPLTIDNDILTWVNGRQLNSYNNNTYKYNHNGIRISKIVNGVETKYYLEGNTIIFEKRNNDVIYYIRNSIDDLIGFKYNDNVYYYIKNLQNDITDIIDYDGNVVASYI